MIKRLKWSVLYGSDNELQADGDLASSDSDEDYERTCRALAELAKNDPRLSVLVENSDEGDDFDYEENAELENDSSGESEGDTDGGKEQKFIEWKECNLCPDKRFLHDTEVETHLRSKGHIRALLKYERLHSQNMPENAAEPCAEESINVPSNASDASALKIARRRERRIKRMRELKVQSASANGVLPVQKDDDTDLQTDRAMERKKLAAKRKLKKLKERKWNLAQERKTVSEDAAKGDEKKLVAEKYEKRSGKAKGQPFLNKEAQVRNSANGRNGEKRVKVKTKKPMSAEKAAIKAKKRELERSTSNESNKKRVKTAASSPTKKRNRAQGVPSMKKARHS